jgi:hypothetical protein
MVTRPRKSPEVERFILDQHAIGTPILEIVRRLDGMAEERGDDTIRCNRSTIYDVLARYKVRTRDADRRFRVLHADATKLTKDMVRHINGTVDRTSMLALIAEFQARWDG